MTLIVDGVCFMCGHRVSEPHDCPQDNRKKYAYRPLLSLRRTTEKQERTQKAIDVQKDRLASFVSYLGRIW